MPSWERACIWVAYVRAFAQCLLKMQGHADHPVAQRVVRQMSPARVPFSPFVICCNTIMRFLLDKQ